MIRPGRASHAARVELIEAASLAAGMEFLAFVRPDQVAVMHGLCRYVDLGGTGLRVVAVREESPGLMAVSLIRISPVPLLVGGTVYALVIVRPPPAICPAAALAEASAHA